MEAVKQARAVSKAKDSALDAIIWPFREAGGGLVTLALRKLFLVDMGSPVSLLL